MCVKLVVINLNQANNFTKDNNAMKDVFSYNPDIYKNAYMNWRTERHEPIHNINTLAQGYFDSAVLSIKECLANNIDRKADDLIFPILFSINHAIELYEKSIC